jgi:S-DNA-T family DNA segregation ATPase FtsK/SpoIIIE
MLFSGGAGRTMRVHGPFVSDEEVEGIVGYLRQQGAPRYVEGVTDGHEPDDTFDQAGGRSQADDLYARAVDIMLRDRKPSISYLQRQLMIGFNRAAGLIERMEREGILSAADARGRRQVLAGSPAEARKSW